MSVIILEYSFSLRNFISSSLRSSSFWNSLSFISVSFFCFSSALVFLLSANLLARDSAHCLKSSVKSSTTFTHSLTLFRVFSDIVGSSHTDETSASISLPHIVLHSSGDIISTFFCVESFINWYRLSTNVHPLVCSRANLYVSLKYFLANSMSLLSNCNVEMFHLAVGCHGVSGNSFHARLFLFIASERDIVSSSVMCFVIYFDQAFMFLNRAVLSPKSSSLTLPVFTNLHIVFHARIVPRFAIASEYFSFVSSVHHLEKFRAFATFNACSDIPHITHSIAGTIILSHKTGILVIACAARHCGVYAKAQYTIEFTASANIFV